VNDLIGRVVGTRGIYRVVIVVNLAGIIPDRLPPSVTKIHAGRHVAAKVIHMINGIFGSWEFRPVIANNLTPGSQEQEIVTTLLVAGGSHADGSKSLRLHTVVMLFMFLDVNAKWKANVPPRVNLLSSDNVSRREFVGDTVGVWESVEPEDRVVHKTTDHHDRDVLERKSVVATLSMVFDSSNVALNRSNMFALSRWIEIVLR